MEFGLAGLQATGGCSRCRMINIDQGSATERRSFEPLLTLSKFRRSNARIQFGQFLACGVCDELAAAAAPPETATVVKVGMPIVVLERGGAEVLNG